MEQVVPDRYSPERELERTEHIRDLRCAVDALPAIEAWVIRRRFGLPERTDLTSPQGSPGEAASGQPADPKSARDYDTMARILGVSRYRVLRTEQSAPRHLRQILGPECDPVDDWGKGR